MSHTKDIIDETLEKIYDELKISAKGSKSGMLNANLYQYLRYYIGYNYNSSIFRILQNLKRYKLINKYYYKNNDKLFCIEFYNLLINNLNNFDEFYEMLEDDESKKDYDWAVKYRIAYAFLSAEIAYNLFTPRISKEYYYKISKSVKYKLSNFYYTIKGENVKISKIDFLSFINTFIIEQYRLPGILQPSFGDTVLDIGACYGDTSLWFLKYIGDKGMVYAFEPINENYKKLLENIRINEVNNIIPFNIAIDERETTVSFLNKGGGSFLVDKGNLDTKTTTIDKFINDNKVSHVDFIKMDIEGAELGALNGSINTIKQFKPKLAICIYHKIDDFIIIPAMIKHLNKNYKFYLRHNSMGIDDTILYVV